MCRKASQLGRTSFQELGLKPPRPTDLPGRRRLSSILPASLLCSSLFFPVLCSEICCAFFGWPDCQTSTFEQPVAFQHLCKSLLFGALHTSMFVSIFISWHNVHECMSCISSSPGCLLGEKRFSIYLIPIHWSNTTIQSFYFDHNSKLSGFASLSCVNPLLSVFWWAPPTHFTVIG